MKLTVPPDWVAEPLAPLAIPTHSLLALSVPPLTSSWEFTSAALTARVRSPASVVVPPVTLSVAPLAPPVTLTAPIEALVAGARTSVPAPTVVAPV